MAKERGLHPRHQKILARIQGEKPLLATELIRGLGGIASTVTLKRDLGELTKAGLLERSG